MIAHVQNSSGSSGRSSMDQERLEELDNLAGGDVGVMLFGSFTVAGSADLTRLPQTNTDNWIRMSLLNGLTLTDNDTLNPSGWGGYKQNGVGSDSGLGHEESAGICRSNSRARRQRDASYSDGIAPIPAAHWKIAIFITLLNPPIGVIALLLCYLTKKEVESGHLLTARKRSKQTLLVVLAGFAISVLVVVLTVVILTAQNKFPFRMEPQTRERKKETLLDLPYVPPPPPPRRTRPTPPPFIPKPQPPVEDVLGDLANQWKNVNASSFDFAQHDELASLFGEIPPGKSPVQQPVAP